MAPIIKTLFSDEPINDWQKKQKSIFLAGPTSRTNDFSKSWRKEMVSILAREGFDGVVYVPEFRQKRPFQPSDWEKQVRWEWELLDAASCILFWVPRHMPEMPGLTTNLEFGTYLQKKGGQVVFGYPPDAECMEWMTLKYESIFGKGAVHHSMESLAWEAIQVANVCAVKDGLIFNV